MEKAITRENFEECIAACNRCADACDLCSVACLSEANVASMARCIRLDMDCAAVCRMAAGAMVRGSEFAQQICKLCAEICDACGEECDKHDHDHCQACAQRCRECAAACREMVV